MLDTVFPARLTLRWMLPHFADRNNVMKIILVATILLLTPTFALSQGAANLSGTDSAKESELRNLINKWNVAESQGDYSYIATLLAKEFCFVGGLTRAQYLSAAGGNDGILTIDESHIEQTNIQIYGETAIVTTLNSFNTQTTRPKFPLDQYWEITMWVRDKGSWKCVKAAEIAREKN
jgi:hypothetical protein